MAIQVSGTEVISNARALNNIASADATTVATLNAAGVGGGFKPVSVSGTSQALNLGTYNFFNANTLTTDTTLSFTSVPTDALWTYTATAALKETTANGATYTGNFKAITAQASNSYGAAYSTDGTKAYVLSSQNSRVYQYNLSTTWNIATATYASIYKDISADEIQSSAVVFSVDGTKMYITGQYYDYARQYNLGTAWNVSTASLAASFYFGSQDLSPRGLHLSPDGTKMYFVGAYANSVFQYNLGTAWNISTASYSGNSKNLDAQNSGAWGVTFSLDGTRMFTGSIGGNSVYQYNLGTAWNVSTATYSGFSIDLSSEVTNVRDISLSSDGLYMLVTESGSHVFQYKVGSAVSITVPASVQNPPTIITSPSDQVSYTFVTNDGGTTVKLINEEVLS
jgi:hypothetical protein